MEPPQDLVALEARLSEAIRDWDDEGYGRVIERIADHLDAAADPEGMLREFDDLVGARIDRLAEAGDSDLANVYGAAVQDFYEACDLRVLAAYLVLHRSEVMIAGDQPAAAEQELREIGRFVEDERDPLCGAAACLLARAVALQGRLEEAIPLLEGAVERAKQNRDQNAAAEATDLLGSVYQEMGRLADAARSFGQAAELWRDIGNAEESEECRKAVAAAEIGLAGQAAERERYDDVESHARRALDAAEGRDESLAAAAAVLLGGARLRLGAPRAAQELIEPALVVLRRLSEPTAVAGLAVALLVLGEALGWQSDIVGADRCFREAVNRAREAGDDGLVEFALLQLAAVSGTRVGLDQQAGLLERLGGGAAEPRLGLLAERNAGMRAMREGEFAQARRYLEDAFQQAQELPDIVKDDMSLHAGRMLSLLAMGRTDEAATCLAAVDDAFLAAQRRGEAELMAAVPPYLEMWHGVLSVARGAHDDAALRLGRAYELFQEAGATLSAAVVSALRGVLAQHRSDASAAAGHLVPAVLAMRSELVTLPSSAERAAFRRAYHNVAELALRAVAATGDHQLLAELLEELQAQSIPLPPAKGTDSLSLNSLVFDLASSSLGSAHAGQVVRADAEQETALAASGRIRMPWGGIALAPYHEDARRYGEHVVGDSTVLLTVLW